MDYVYDAEEWPTLSADERVRRCRLWAADARNRALYAAGDTRDLYLFSTERLNLAHRESQQPVSGETATRPTRIRFSAEQRLDSGAGA